MEEKTKQSNDTGKNKLNEKQKEQLLIWLAEGLQPTQVCNLIRKEFDMSFAPATVSYYKKNYKDKIQEKREELNENIQDYVPYANKFVRIRELAKVAEEARADNNYKDYRQIVNDIAKEMGELEETININATAKDGIMAAYKKRKGEDDGTA